MTREEEREFVVKEYKKMLFNFLCSLALTLAVILLIVVIIVEMILVRR